MRVDTEGPINAKIMLVGEAPGNSGIKYRVILSALRSRGVEEFKAGRPRQAVDACSQQM